MGASHLPFLRYMWDNQFENPQIQNSKIFVNPPPSHKSTPSPSNKGKYKSVKNVRFTPPNLLVLKWSRKARRIGGLFHLVFEEEHVRRKSESVVS